MRALYCLSLVCLPGALHAQAADLVLRNGTIYTGVSPQATARAVAVRDGQVVYVGSTAGLARFVGPLLCGFLYDVAQGAGSFYGGAVLMTAALLIAMRMRTG